MHLKLLKRYQPRSHFSHPDVFVCPCLAQKYDIPLEDLRAKHDGKRLVVGAAIFNPGRTKLLVVKRAVHEESFANLYELPGGHADSPADSSDGKGDLTILDAVVRETKEETGLMVTAIVNEFHGFEYEASGGRLTIQFNFVVEVEEADTIILNPEEHRSFAWVGPGDNLDALGMTGEMREVVVAAVRLLS